MQFRVKVTPNGRKNEILGWEEHPEAGRLLRVRLQAPPAEGRANKALLQLLSMALGVPKSRVILSRGASSRIKTVAVPDDTSLP